MKKRFTLFFLPPRSSRKRSYGSSLLQRSNACSQLHWTQRQGVPGTSDAMFAFLCARSRVCRQAELAACRAAEWSPGSVPALPRTPQSALVVPIPPSHSAPFLVGKKSRRHCPRKKTTSGFARVGWPVICRSSGESMSVGRLLIPTRRGVGGFLAFC